MQDQEILEVLVVVDNIKQEAPVKQEEQEILHHSHHHKVIMEELVLKHLQVHRLVVEAVVVLRQDHQVLVEMPLPLREQAGLVGQVLQYQ